MPGVKQAKAAMAMMPDLEADAERRRRRCRASMASGGNAFESMQKVMADFSSHGPAAEVRRSAASVIAPRPGASASGRVSAPMPRRRVVIGGRELTLDARPDRLDFRDLPYRRPRGRFRPGIRPTTRSRDHVRHYAAANLVLDQGEEGACTGFGLAAVVKYLLWAARRSGRRPTLLSARACSTTSRASTTSGRARTTTARRAAAR